MLLAPEEGRPVLGGTGRIGWRWNTGSTARLIIGCWMNFKDTSTAQWRVVENLVDEAVQDPDRSFFCVGDVKQSIYGWRGGDPHLFGRWRRITAMAPAMSSRCSPWTCPGDQRRQCWNWSMPCSISRCSSVNLIQWRQNAGRMSGTNINPQSSCRHGRA